MNNVARNGFGCPYCRTVLAELPEETESENDEWEEEEEEMFDDYALRGFRFFMNQLYGEDHEEEDILEEEEDEELEEEDEENLALPSPAFVTQKLVENGVTIEHLVKSLLTQFPEYEENEELDRVESELWGKFRVIISNYIPPPPPPEPQNQSQSDPIATVIQEVQEPVHPNNTLIAPPNNIHVAILDKAEPKITLRRRNNIEAV
jgi:hypothetical protein